MNILETLEFNQIQERLAEQCQFAIAAQRALETGPASDIDQVEYLLNVTAEALELLEDQPGFTIGGARDIRDALDRAKIGSVLGPADLLLVLDTIDACSRVRRLFLRIEDARERLPSLLEFVQWITEQPALAANLRRTVGEGGEILDTASEELGRIRRQLRSAQSRAAERIRRYVQDDQYAKALQESLVTTRDGRYVVPVRADRRSQLPGMVHDTSSSGQTLYVEPTEMVEINNQVRELQAAEQHEIERILAWLTDQIADAAEDLLLSLDALSAIDLAVAKARLAQNLDASRPEIVETEAGAAGVMDLRQARHPLIPRDVVVPIDVHLGDDFRILVITGPNTGGKTVALKTVGLCAIMAQSGLFIPADDGSRLPVFDGIFADIGDEQSIEQSLSTFSSHLVRVIATLKNVTNQSLVLLDELGAGTDPEEGSALARAIIEQLLDSGCLAIATTHYPELKTYAYATDNVENASVEFNVETLSPTYRLSIGIPGRSNALAIAQRLGMDAEIIDQARNYIDPNLEHADVLLAEIKSRHADAQRMLAEAEQRERQAASYLEEAEERRAEAEREALAELERDLAEAREHIRSVRSIPERLEQKQVADTRKSAQQQLDQAAQQVRQRSRERAEERPQQPRPMKVGDTVELLALGGEGEIVGFADGGSQADVQMGAFKVRQPVRDLRRIKSSQPARRTPSVKPPAPRRKVDMELHLRGQRVSGIEPILDEYLNDAYLAHLPFVRIVHGKGTGALRDAVREILRRHPLVIKFETPPEREGGEGVTIAYLKEA